MPKRTDINKILIIGSGPIIIGQACEFDYSGTQACKALRKLGYEIVLVNSNPATIMTDPETADVTYIEPLNVERLEQIIAKERPDALLPNLGGQSGLNLCSELNQAGVLEKYNVEVIGVQVDAIGQGGQGCRLLPGDEVYELGGVIAAGNLQRAGDLAVDRVLHNHVQYGTALIHDGVELSLHLHGRVPAGDGVLLSGDRGGKHVPSGCGGNVHTARPQQSHIAHNDLPADPKLFGQRGGTDGAAGLLQPPGHAASSFLCVHNAPSFFINIVNHTISRIKSACKRDIFAECGQKP